MQTSERLTFPTRAIFAVAVVALLLGLTGCETEPKKTPAQALNAAFSAMNLAVAADVDDSDHEDMEAARERYRKGVTLLKTNADEAVEAGEDSEVLAQYAQARVAAKIAADTAAKARKEVEDLKRLAKVGEVE